MLAKEQFDRQQQLEATVARNAATFERYRFVALDNQLDIVIKSGVVANRPTEVGSRLSTVQLTTMIAHFGPSDVDVYARAERCLAGAAIELKEQFRTGDLLDHDELASFKGWRTCIIEGERVVKAIAEGRRS